ncbi:FAD-dependent monooxygenase [Streptomyces sp. SID10853]|uniref:FAD-dependent monooxygenase n=1 Tax=Streptomyces sp. SID10853 TaxID=2706028 RepID=UPI001EF168D1|nr:FAD-dependent monooxygenase [Streptomyces sp. SID10853]
MVNREFKGEEAGMRILVSGAGVAGLSAGIDLARAGHTVEIVERAGHLRINGSPIDVRGDSVGVVERMGLLDEVTGRSITMTEGAKFVDDNGDVIAPQPMSETNDSDDDIEIPREDLMRVLRKALPEEAQLRFEDSVRTLTDDGDQVTVVFESGREGRYDLVVGADGAHSNVRRQAFGPEREFSRHLGLYVAIGAAPEEAAPENTAHSVHILNLPGRMACIGRYRDQALAIFTFRSEEIEYDHHDLAAQKRILTDFYGEDRQWRIPQLLSAAQADPELYFDAIAQIHMPTWHRGRVVLIGDAAHCATPMAGRGTSLALTGAWLLTEALTRHDGDHTAAFTEYERRQRPYSDKAQESANGGADLMVPATWEDIERRNARLLPAR